MSTIENEIKANYRRMKQPLTVRVANQDYGNTAPTWEALSQYGYPLAYCGTQAEAEQYIINFYGTRMHLIRQG